MSLDYFKKFIKPTDLSVNNFDVWTYTRVSSKDQFDRNNSVKNQINACKKYAEDNNYLIVNTFGGTYESANTDFTRKEFNRLINEVKKSKVKPFAIMIFKMSRFSRSGGPAIGLVNELIHELGVHLIEVSTEKDTTTSRGEHEIYEALLSSRKENIERLEITLPGLKAHIKNGNWLGNVPRGYDHFGPRVKRHGFTSNQQKIVINEEGRLLKKAWKWKLDGLQDNQILEELNLLGLKVSKQFLSSMWRKPFYCGISTHKFTEGEPIKGNWPPLVSPKNFKIIEQRLEEGNVGYKQSKQHEGRPLQGVLYCGICSDNGLGDVKFTGYKAKNKYDKYKCQNKNCKCKDLRATDTKYGKGMNTLFAEYLKEIELNNNLKEVFKAQMKLTINQLSLESKNDLPFLEKRLKELKLNLKELEKNNAFGKVPEEIYKDLKLELNQEIHQIQEKKLSLSEQISNLDDKLNICADFVSNISNSWDSGDLEIKSKLQKLIFPKGIVLDPINKQYRTKVINSVFVQISNISRAPEDKKKRLIK